MSKFMILFVIINALWCIVNAVNICVSKDYNEAKGSILVVISEIALLLTVAHKEGLW
jgi:hypothetical protein